jgi:hypothetical protein
MTLWEKDPDHSRMKAILNSNHVDFIQEGQRHNPYVRTDNHEEFMPRYFFHFVSPHHVVRDSRGVELAGLSAAHWYAVKLVYQMHAHVPKLDDDWKIEVTDQTGATPLVVLSSSVPMQRLRRASK